MVADSRISKVRSNDYHTCRLAMHRRDMRVDIERDRDRRVAKYLADHQTVATEGIVAADPIMRHGMGARWANRDCQDQRHHAPWVASMRENERGQLAFHALPLRFMFEPATKLPPKAERHIVSQDDFRPAS
jgi:hypothetical protein